MYSCLLNLLWVIIFFSFRIMPIFSNSKQLLGSFYLQNPPTDVILPLPWLINKLSSGNLIFFFLNVLWSDTFERSSCKSMLIKTLSCFIKSSCHVDPSPGCVVYSLVVAITRSHHPCVHVSFPAGVTLGASGFVAKCAKGNVKNPSYLCRLAFVGMCCVIGFNCTAAKCFWNAL